ncbi:MAG: alanine racemase [Anaerolineales bacterium]|nr:MAG: alanine racemase [Anaerolineales bacterium]
MRIGLEEVKKIRQLSDNSFDPWVEIIAAAIQNNVREVYRFANKARILFVVKNNAYGLGLQAVGPIVDEMDEVYGYAVVRVDEALVLREIGVRKPILLMAHVCQSEAEELVRQDVMLTLFHDNAKEQIESLAKKLNRPVPVQLYIETGMNRIGMPYERALPWIEELAASKAIKIAGTYTMTAGAKRGDVSFDDVQLERFMNVIEQSRKKGIDTGVLHAAPSRMIVKTPASHQLGIVRPGHVIFGGAIYNFDEDGNRIMNLELTFRLKARVVRVENVREGEGVSFGHRYIAKKPTWIATIPIGHTDGYPCSGANNADVLIGGKVYPIIAGGVNANLILAEIGENRTVNVGDIATVIGTDHPDIAPQSVAEKTGLDSDYWIMTKLNPLLHRKVV